MTRPCDYDPREETICLLGIEGPHFFLRSFLPCLPEAALAYLKAMLGLLSVANCRLTLDADVTTAGMVSVLASGSG